MEEDFERSHSEERRPSRLFTRTRGITTLIVFVVAGMSVWWFSFKPLSSQEQQLVGRWMTVHGEVQLTSSRQFHCPEDNMMGTWKLDGDLFQLRYRFYSNENVIQRLMRNRLSQGELQSQDWNWKLTEDGNRLELFVDGADEGARPFIMTRVHPERAD